eukprot:TRINITY_DN9223_c0_g1_i1.p1 TRINITY_DN9223_c0_g1~~TRINITY_DN9223_c0_g1_i1.p1  ORF type:complete len:154 (-),score=37.22 TRINITY_DN9223_c0_g1_i1:595-1056(-)
MRKEHCVFSGLPVHPGHGKKYVPTIVQSTRPVLTFLANKTFNLYLKKRNPRDIRWTVTYRRVNKKTVTMETIRKRVTKVKKVARPIQDFDLERIKAKKNQRLEIRTAAKEAALKELRDRKAKKDAEKKKTAVPKTHQQQPKPTKLQQPKKGGR